MKTHLGDLEIETMAGAVVLSQTGGENVILITAELVEPLIESLQRARRELLVQRAHALNTSLQTPVIQLR